MKLGKTITRIEYQVQYRDPNRNGPHDEWARYDNHEEAMSVAVQLNVVPGIQSVRVVKREATYRVADVASDKELATEQLP